MKLVWSRFALSDRDDIFSYIEVENPVPRFMSTNRLPMPRGACSTFLTAADPGVSLARASWSSRARLMSAYLVDSDTIRILRVLHGAQMWPDELTNGD